MYGKLCGNLTQTSPINWAGKFLQKSINDLTAQGADTARGDVFVVRTSKPVENLWKRKGYFDRVTVSLHILYTANQETEGSQDRLLGTSCLCVSEDMACGYWFSKWQTTKLIWVWIIDRPVFPLSMFTISKTPLFSFLLWRKVFGDLFLMMVFHRRSKRVKIFSETFVTKYLYKRDSNTSKRTCILIHNYLKEKTRKKKGSVLIS